MTSFLESSTKAVLEKDDEQRQKEAGRSVPVQTWDCRSNTTVQADMSPLYDGTSLWI